MSAWEQDESAALRWIVGVMSGVKVPFQAVGGLAARAHGASRRLVDLDFYLPARNLRRIVREVGEHCVWGPEHFRDQNWDLTFAKLDRQGVRIELAAAEDARFFSHLQGRWLEQKIDFERSERHEVLGVEIPVMPRAQLVAYKRELDRAVDRLDLEELR